MNVISIGCLTLALTALTPPGAALADQSKPKDEKVISLTGCLTKASDNGHQLTVMTTSAKAPVVTTATVYRLVAIPPAAEVTTHEKHRVTVTGWLTGPPPKSSSAATGAAKPAPVLEVRVKDILHVADSCK